MKDMYISDELRTRVSPRMLEKFDEVMKLGFVRRLDIRKIDLPNGEISGVDAAEERKIKDMKGYFQDETAYALENPEKIVYRVFRKNYPEISYGITELFPGKIGREYFMTKGHFHKRVEAPGIYFCIKGFGVVVMQHKDEYYAPLVAPFDMGTIALMAPYYAHRVVNVGEESLIFIGLSATDSGISYSSLERKGFKLIIVEENQKATIQENPRYK